MSDEPKTYGDILPKLAAYCIAHPLNPNVEEFFGIGSPEVSAAQDALLHGIGVMKLTNPFMRAIEHIPPEDFYNPPENDPMNITINIREIANGFLIDLGDSERDYIGGPRAEPYFHPTIENVLAALPGHVQGAIDAVKQAEADKERYMRTGVVGSLQDRMTEVARDALYPRPPEATDEEKAEFSLSPAEPDYAPLPEEAAVLAQGEQPVLDDDGTVGGNLRWAVTTSDTPPPGFVIGGETFDADASLRSELDEAEGS
jgi:hypothetical protein